MSSIKGPYIVAVEGPAGSGKSTWIRQQVLSKPDYHFIQRPQWPRQMNAEDGAINSSVYEFHGILDATLYRTPVLMDRFLLSRWVYRALQSGSLTNSFRSEMNSSWRNMRNCAVNEAHARLDQDKIYVQPPAHITVLLPAYSELSERRNKTVGKTYPFSAQDELDLYYIIATALMEHPIFGIDVTIQLS